MLKLERVTKMYRTGTFGGQEFAAVRDVSFDVNPGEVVSLIGESGSGKSTIGKMILRLVRVNGGRITFDGTTIGSLPLKDYYRRVQGVFQDPFSSYNPVFKADRVFGMIRMQYFPSMSNPEWKRKLIPSLEAVTLSPEDVLNKYPHQLSGGQLQRLLVARALLLDIKILVADEIISMLDASTRIDVLNLLGDLKARGLGILFITHDLSLGNYISERSVILRHGRVVEMGATQKVFGNPTHPYTRSLVAAVPQLHKKWAEVEAELKAGGGKSAGVCLYHQAYPQAGSAAGGAAPAARKVASAASGAAPAAGADVPGLAKVEDDHFVGCFQLEDEAACRVA